MENDSGHNGDDNNNANKTGTTKTIDGLMQATVMNNNETRQGLINLVRIFGSNCSCPWWARADWQSLTHTDTHTHTHTHTHTRSHSNIIGNQNQTNPIQIQIRSKSDSVDCSGHSDWLGLDWCVPFDVWNKGIKKQTQEPNLRKV